MIARVSYNTSGSAGPYTITFPYLEEADVEVYLDDVLVDSADYTFPSATTILLDSAPSETVIEIRRNTENDPYVDFVAPAPLTPEDLDTATLQAIYIAQEAKDGDEVLQDNIDTEEAARIAADAALQDDIDDVADDLAAAQIEAGNVPTPGDPADDGKVLTADGGLYDWVDPAVTVAQISDASANGRSLISAANYAAMLTLLGAAAASHVHAAADITSGTIATARLGSGTANNTTFLRGDQTWQTVSSGLQPVFVMAPESAAFPASNFPQLKKAVGTNWVSYSLGFDSATDEAAYWKFKIPTTAVFTAATIKIVSRQLAATTGNAAWQVTTITRADGEAYDTAGVTDDVAAAAVKGTAGMLLFQSQALTVTGWAAGEMLYVKLNRDVSADDVAEDCELVCAMIELS